MLRPTTFVILALASNASAGPDSIVPGGQDPESPSSGYANKSVDIWTEVDYAYELDSSSLVREVIDTMRDPLDGTRVISDLEFKQFRHTITPRLQVGVFRDTFVTAALPIVIQQARELRFLDPNQRAGSTAVADGLLPMQGFDANDPTTPTAGDLAFRGPNRHGIDQVHVGLGTAFMNQLKDDTKPTWKIGAEVRLAVGTVMKFDPMAPTSNRGVSRGVQELKLWTTFARKLGWAEPWVELWWMTPLTAKSGSLFEDPGFGATNVTLSQQAAIASGLELYVLDNRADETRISVDIGSRFIAHFEGREYTELWEMFALAGDSRGMGPLVLDSNPIDNGVQPMSHPGISNIENYLEMTGRFAMRAQIGPHVRFAVIGDLIWRTDHAISFADAGVDNEDDNDLVNPGTDEVNPLHAQTVDLVGHRYRSVNGFDIIIGVSGQVLF